MQLPVIILQSCTLYYGQHITHKKQQIFEKGVIALQQLRYFAEMSVRCWATSPISDELMLLSRDSIWRSFAIWNIRQL